VNRTRNQAFVWPRLRPESPFDARPARLDP
jgi:hypothetical protein